MARDWTEYRIGDIAEIVGGSTPSTADATNFNGDIPWLTPKDLSGQHERYVSRGERNLSQRGLASCSAKLLPAGAVLLSSRAPIGYVAIARNPIATNQGFRSLILKSGFEPEFVYYWLKANVNNLERHASGSTFRELSGSALAEIKIKIPGEATQRAIARILGTLDDKIELNRRMNETLEAMARAIFKSWFVDFDPVIDNALRAGNPIPSTLAEKAARRREMLARAKSEGRDSCFPKHIADLFPDSFVDSALGPIPAGWELLSFDEMVIAKQGKYLPNDEMREYPTSDYIYPVWGGRGIRGYTNRKTYNDSVIVITCRGSYCGLLDLTEPECYVSNIAFACEPKFGSPYFIYIYFSFCSFNDCISGSAQPQITYRAMKNKKMRFPVSVSRCEAYSNLIDPLFKKILFRKKESRALAAVRDELLSKLIMAEIRVKDAERFLKEHGL